MRHRWSVAVACAVLAVPATASPAGAMTGSWADGVLTITASPGDGDVVIDVYDNRGDELDVMTSPFVDLSGSACHYVTGPGGSGWVCEGGSPSHVVLDGGAGHADLSVNAYERPTWVEVTAGAEGGAIDINATSATVTGTSAPDRVSVSGGVLRAELHGGDDQVVWGDTVEVGLVSLGAGDDGFLVLAPAVAEPDMPRAAVQGGSGSDVISAQGRTMRSYGGPGDDRFLPDTTYTDLLGSEHATVSRHDMVDGGPGVDMVVLANPERSGPVRVTLDGKADDGERGEHDNYGADVENVLVELVPAVVVGNRLDNRIELRVRGTARGGRGDDVLVGGARLVGGRGHDVLRGGRSTHLIVAVDGTRDVVRCRTGDTVVRVDPVDDVSDTCVHVLR